MDRFCDSFSFVVSYWRDSFRLMEGSCHLVSCFVVTVVLIVAGGLLRHYHRPVTTRTHQAVPMSRLVSPSCLGLNLTYVGVVSFKKVLLIVLLQGKYLFFLMILDLLSLIHYVLMFNDTMP